MKTTYLLKPLIIAALGTIALQAMYFAGSWLAAQLGFTQRGGVSWGLGIQHFSYVIAVVLLAQSYLHHALKMRAIKIMVVSILVYTALSFAFLGNNFSGGNWSHPYRYSFFMLCSYLVIAAPFFWPMKRWATSSS